MSALDFFDSNILIAGLVTEHTHHVASFRLLATLASGNVALAAHSLAETYNTLTKCAVYKVPCSEAAQMVRHVSRTYALVALTAEETVYAIEDAAAHGVTGPTIYDALILTCARKIDARFIYTYNVKHFRDAAPDLADRIVEP